jgi:hypothetical protein
MFRRFPKKEGGEVIALFPYELDDYQGYKCSSYMHVGQHASAGYSAIVSCTKPAKLTDVDVVALTAELEHQIGYRLVPAQMVNARLLDKARLDYRTHLKRSGAVPSTWWPEIALTAAE